MQLARPRHLNFWVYLWKAAFRPTELWTKLEAAMPTKIVHQWLEWTFHEREFSKFLNYCRIDRFACIVNDLTKSAIHGNGVENLVFLHDGVRCPERNPKVVGCDMKTKKLQLTCPASSCTSMSCNLTFSGAVLWGEGGRLAAKCSACRSVTPAAGCKQYG